MWVYVQTGIVLIEFGFLNIPDHDYEFVLVPLINWVLCPKTGLWYKGGKLKSGEHFHFGKQDCNQPQQHIRRVKILFFNSSMFRIKNFRGCEQVGSHTFCFMSGKYPGVVIFLFSKPSVTKSNVEGSYRVKWCVEQLVSFRLAVKVTKTTNVDFSC